MGTKNPNTPLVASSFPYKIFLKIIYKPMTLGHLLPFLINKKRQTHSECETIINIVINTKNMTLFQPIRKNEVNFFIIFR